jgi:hypothetical protein
MRTTHIIERIVLTLIVACLLAIAGKALFGREMSETDTARWAQTVAMEYSLDTPGDYTCSDSEGNTLLTIHNITPNYALTHFCDRSVCGEVSSVCAKVKTADSGNSSNVSTQCHEQYQWDCCQGHCGKGDPEKVDECRPLRGTRRPVCKGSTDNGNDDSGPVASYQRRLITRGKCYAECMWSYSWSTNTPEPQSKEGSACTIACASQK